MKRFLTMLICAAALCSCSKADYSMYFEYSDGGGLWLGDENLQRYCLECFDEDSDGALTPYELSQVRTMDCGRRGIQTLPLEYFPNLDTLSCEGNRLVNLDLSAVPNLRYLNCSENYIRDLNVSVADVSTLFCCPMDDSQGAVILEYVYVRRSQKIEGVTYGRAAANPKRVPDETIVIAIPD